MPNIFTNFKDRENANKELEENLLFLQDARVARIKSKGQISPDGFWYEQDEDEWVIVLAGEGEIKWPCGTKRLLKSGDWLFLPKHQKHQVSYTSIEPPCVWLAIYGKITMEADIND